MEKVKDDFSIGSFCMHGAHFLWRKSHTRFLTELSMTLLFHNGFIVYIYIVDNEFVSHVELHSYAVS